MVLVFKASDFYNKDASNSVIYITQNGAHKLDKHIHPDFGIAKDHKIGYFSIQDIFG